jgi:hypothetical protein
MEWNGMKWNRERQRSEWNRERQRSEWNRQRGVANGIAIGSVA